jgi:hypothetical protein
MEVSGYIQLSYSSGHETRPEFCKMKYCEEFNLDLSEGSFGYQLGINFNVDTHLMPKLNMDKAKSGI